MIQTIKRSPAPRGLMARMGYLLNRPALHMRRHAEELLKPLGITPPHFGVMATLESEGAQTQRALGHFLKIDPTTMVWLIDDLEKEGYVRRAEHPEDRRAHLVTLSSSGKAVFQKASRQLEQLERKFLEPLSKDEREQLRQLLLKLLQSVATQDIPRS